MLHDFPRQKLRTLVLEYGPAIMEDTRRCRALLLDYCSEYPREVNVLVKAQEEGIPASLRALTTHSAMTLTIPPALRLAQLTRQLADMWMLEETAAQWAVESWALALNVIQTPEKCEDAKKDEQKETGTADRQPQKEIAWTPHIPRYSAPPRRVRENADPWGLGAVVIIVGILVTCMSVGNAANRPTPRPTLDAEALLAQATASAQLFENLGLNTAAPDNNRLTLQTPDGRINCTGTDLTLDLTWNLSGAEELDAHYRYEVYSGDSEETPRQRIAEGIVATPAISVTLPCNPYAHYGWRVSASNMVAEWSKVDYFTVRCQQHLCEVRSWRANSGYQKPETR